MTRVERGDPVLTGEAAPHRRAQALVLRAESLDLRLELAHLASRVSLLELPSERCANTGHVPCLPERDPCGGLQTLN